LTGVITYERELHPLTLFAFKVSAELHDIIHEDLSRIYPDLIPYHKISVYDVAPKVLPMFDEKLAKYATDTFHREGIAIKTNHHVESLQVGSPNSRKNKGEDDHACFTLKVKEEGELGVGMVVWSMYLPASSRFQLLGIDHLTVHCQAPA
jgi:NADH dehydrogenase FAD-containing subunit